MVLAISAAVGITALATPDLRDGLNNLAAPQQGIALSRQEVPVGALRPPAPKTPTSGRPAFRAASGPLLAPAAVAVDVPGFFSWALLDRQTNTISGSANHAKETSTTESMVKGWLAADYLSRLGNRKADPSRLADLSAMIRDSNNQAAEKIYKLDGYDNVIKRMISTCGLTDTRVSNGWWSMTEISARDAVRLGLCLADGRAAGPRWTSWLLSEMRKVRGEGRFGIIEALPPAVAEVTSIKNGWTEFEEDDQWHVACLAVHADWVLAALVRYPLKLGLAFGARVCQNVAEQLQTR